MLTHKITLATDAAPVTSAPATVPAWVAVLDAVTLVLLGAAAVLIVGDGVRFEIAGLRLSMTSPARLLAWAAVAAVTAMKTRLARMPKSVSCSRRWPSR